MVVGPEIVPTIVVTIWVVLPPVRVSDEDDDGEMAVPDRADDPVDHGSVLVMVLVATVTLAFEADEGAEDDRVSVETVTVII